MTSAVFSPDSGLDQQSIELSDGGYAWINVLSTEAPKQKPFEDVKEDVKGQFMANERARLVSEIATVFVKRVNAGEPMSALEAAAGITVQKTGGRDAVHRPAGALGSSRCPGLHVAAGQGRFGSVRDQQSRTILLSQR